MSAASKNWRLRQHLWTFRCVLTFITEPSLDHRWNLLLTATANNRRYRTPRRLLPDTHTLPAPLRRHCIMQTTRLTTLDPTDLDVLVATVPVISFQYPTYTRVSHLPHNTTEPMSARHLDHQQRYTLQVAGWFIQANTFKSSDRHLQLTVIITVIIILHRRPLPLTSYRLSTPTVSALLHDRRWLQRQDAVRT